MMESEILSNELEDLFSKISALGRSISIVTSKGTLYQRYNTCGKPCHCTRTKGHGAYWYLKTSNNKDIYIGKELPEGFLEQREMFRHYQRLKKLYEKIIILEMKLKPLIREFQNDADTFLMMYGDDE